MSANNSFKRIALMGRQRQNNTRETLLSLYEYLISKGHSVVFEQETAEHLQPANADIIPGESLNKSCDIIIVVGGDGSLLHAAQVAVSQNLPILGVNRGRLGFLTDMHPNEFEKIESVLEGNYKEEQRFLLRAEVLEKENVIESIEGLNEVVLFPRDVTHMLDFQVMVNNQLVCSLRADGLIMATPTGSTAYALSGGGPIVHPSLNAIAMVPMFPHTLTNRPIVIDANSCIAIKVSEDNATRAYISADGQRRIEIPVGNTVFIQKKTEHLRLIHPLDYSYFQTLRTKLHWQSKHA